MRKYDCTKLSDFQHELDRLRIKRDKWGLQYEETELYKNIANKQLLQLIEEDIEALQRWSDSRPEKTRQDKFLEMFPNAVLENGMPTMLPCKLDKNIKNDDKHCYEYRGCYECRKEYWSESYEE